MLLKFSKEEENTYELVEPPISARRAAYIGDLGHLILTSKMRVGCEALSSLWELKDYKGLTRLS